MADLLEKISTARQSGFSNREILDHLAKTDPRVLEARGEGFDDDNIIQFLTTGKPFAETTAGEVIGERVTGGAANVIAGIAGAPVQAVTELINIAGRIVSTPINAEEIRLAKTSAAFTGDFSGIPDPIFEEPPLLDPSQSFGGIESIRGGLETAGVKQPVPLEQLPPDLRPLAVASEVVGGSLLPMMGPFAIAQKSAGLLKPVVNAARQFPKMFLTAEASSVAGAAGAGALAEVFDPGNPTTRFISEVAGGFFSPTSILARGGREVGGGITNLVKSFTKSGREDEAARLIQNVVEESGEDIDDVIRLLSKPELPGVKLTAGQKTGSPALLAIESKLASKSSRFAGEAEDKATNSLKQLRELTDNFAKSGDPAAIRVAAKARQQYFDTLLQRRLDDAGQDALEVSGKLKGGKADLAEISVGAKGILDKALKEARGAERELWNKIPKNTPMGTQNLVDDTLDATQRFLLESENLPTVVQAEITRLTDKGANLGDMLKFRSRLMTLGRSAGSKGDFNDKALFDALADGIRKDLDELPPGVADEARAFSKSLHDNFTRTFAGDALARSRTGAEKINPELLLERAFGSGGTRGDIQFGELAEAADFPNQVFGRPMLDTQEKFLEVAAGATLDDAGRVNPQKLQTFLTNNQAILNRFPDLRGKLNSAAAAEDAFRGVEAAGKVASKAIQQRTAFANILKTEDPVVAVGEVLSGKDARRNYSQLSKLAKRSGEGSVAGLRSSTIKNVFDKSHSSTGTFSFQKMDDILKKGLSKEDQGVMSLMRQNGVIDKGASDRLNSIVRRGIEIEKALTNQKKLDQLVAEPDALFDLIVRIAGAKAASAGLAGKFAGFGGGGGLVVAQAGSKFARNFAEKIPASKTSEVLELAVNDTRFLSLLLKKTRTFKEKAALERQINAFLISSGLQFDEGNENDQ